ncbi:MAG TPA: 3-phosphoshikimate 1-carboxyvinyltransferase [Fimbriimonadaceae bacterium]|nr:3-phosphoshikimate 1-carboxyvinyltransferase [Fimbriimonadaceae bacterium]
MSGPLKGTVRPPSDKSLTHRSYIFSAFARTPSTIINPLRGEDCNATLEIMRQIGARAEVHELPDTTKVFPIKELVSPSAPLECGNSGTTMRLLCGVLAAQEGLSAMLVGDASLSRRPMKRVTDPLRMMGANIEGDTAPITIKGGALHGIDYTSPVASAQIKSCVLLAGLFASGRTCVTEPETSRDHTERMLRSLKVPINVDGNTACVEGGQKWDGFTFEAPADISSAAFLLCAAAIVPGSHVVLRGVGANPTRTGVIDALRAAGAILEESPKDEQMGEPVSDYAVTHTPGLRAFEIGGALVPRLIDEIPVLAVLATQCDGTTKIRDAKELRVKESDRIDAVAGGLRAMGAEVETTEDGMDVHGPVQLKGATIDAEGDHRIGMAFAVAGLAAQGETTILNADSIQTSYPQFVSDVRSLQA